MGQIDNLWFVAEEPELVHGIKPDWSVFVSSDEDMDFYFGQDFATLAEAAQAFYAAVGYLGIQAQKRGQAQEPIRFVSDMPEAYQDYSWQVGEFYITLCWTKE